MNDDDPYAGGVKPAHTTGEKYAVLREIRLQCGSVELLVFWPSTGELEYVYEHPRA